MSEKRFLNINNHLILNVFDKIFSLLIIVFSFVWPRLAYWTEYNIPYIASDTWDYLGDSIKILSDGITNVPLIGSGYPLFLAMMDFFNAGYRDIVYVQQALMFISCSLLVILIGKSLKNFFLPAAIAVSIFLANPQTLQIETTILTEAIFVPLLILFTVAIIGLFLSKSSSYIFLIPFFLVFVLISRPASLYLAVIYLLILLVLVIQKESIKKITIFIFPIIIFFIVNFMWPSSEVGSKATRNLSGATVIFWEKNDSYSEKLNELIEKTTKNIKIEDKEAYMLTWDPILLYSFIRKYYKHGIRVGLESGKGEKYFCKKYGDASFASLWKKTEKVIGNLPYEIIQNCPKCYVKFFWANFYRFFITGSESKFNFYKYAGRRLKSVYATTDEKVLNGVYYKKFCKTSSGSELDFYTKDSNIISSQHVNFTDITSFLNKLHRTFNLDLKDVEVVKTDLLKKYRRYYNRIYHVYFENKYWVMGFAIVFLWSVFLLIKSKAQDKIANIIFFISLMPIGAGMLTSLLQPSIPRYIHPTKWAIYVVVIIGLYILTKYLLDKFTKKYQIVFYLKKKSYPTSKS